MFDYISEVTGVVVGIITTVSAAVLILVSKNKSDRDLAEKRQIVVGDLLGLKDKQIEALEESNRELQEQVTTLTEKLIDVEKRLAAVSDTLIRSISMSELCLDAKTCPKRRMMVGGEA